MVSAAKQDRYSKSAEGSAEAVNKLSNEIYKLNEKANAINEVTDSFDKLDNKIIKTNKDIEEMNSLLEQLFTLENPYHCPHGRPTMISMSKTDLEKKFKRIV